MIDRHPADFSLGDWPSSNNGYQEAKEVLHKMAAKIKEEGKENSHSVFLLRVRMGFGDPRWVVYLRDIEEMRRYDEKRMSRMSEGKPPT